MPWVPRVLNQNLSALTPLGNIWLRWDLFPVYRLISTTKHLHLTCSYNVQVSLSIVVQRPSQVHIPRVSARCPLCPQQSMLSGPRQVLTFCGDEPAYYSQDLHLLTQTFSYKKKQKNKTDSRYAIPTYITSNITNIHYFPADKLATWNKKVKWNVQLLVSGLFQWCCGGCAPWQ